MAFVARTVKEAPDCEPQCGVGRGEISSDLTLLSFPGDGDVMMIIVSVFEYACSVYEYSKLL